MKSLATRLTGEGIRSNVIAPGPFSTEMTMADGIAAFGSKNPDDPRALVEGSVSKEAVPLVCLFSLYLSSHPYFSLFSPIFQL